LKIEAAGSSKLLATVYQITWRQISIGGVLHSCHCENLKSPLNLRLESKSPVAAGIILVQKNTDEERLKFVIFLTLEKSNIYMLLKVH
jgi:hypothetical protein